MHGVRTKTAWYRVFYGVLTPLYPLLKHVPKYVTTTECVGRAMIRVAREGFATPVLESLDITKFAASKSRFGCDNLGRIVLDL